MPPAVACSPCAPGQNPACPGRNPFCPTPQPSLCAQAIRFLHDAMPAPLWLRPYHILSTGPRSGLIEMVTDTKSLDQLKQ